MYTVTRQIQWPDEKYFVEISEGGIDYCNPDALSEKYPGEFEEFLDPAEAVEVALLIAESWKKDKPDQDIYIGYGNTLGYTMPFEASNIEEIKQWAKEELETIPICCMCGELMDTDKEQFEDEYGDIYCSERCIEKALYEEEVKEND